MDNYVFRENYQMKKSDSLSECHSCYFMISPSSVNYAHKVQVSIVSS